MVFGLVTSDGDILPLLPTWPHTQHEGQHQVAGGGSAEEGSGWRRKCYLDRKSDCWKTQCLASGFCAMPRKQEKPVLTVRKFLQPHHL